MGKEPRRIESCRSMADRVREGRKQDSKKFQNIVTLHNVLQ